MRGIGFSEKGLTLPHQIWTIIPMNFPRIFLKTKEEIDIKLGQPWVFDNEIAFVKLQTSKGIEQISLEECFIPDGSPVEVYSKGGLFLGTGIINLKSKITIRLLSAEKPEQIFGKDAVYENLQTIHSEQLLSFFEKKVKDALDARFLFYKKSDSYRLIFAEADFIPGFVVDRFCDIEGRVFLSVQILSLSAEVFRTELIDALRTVCHPFGIYERSDASVRKLEGLEIRNGWIGPEHNPVITIKENGVLLSIDLENGQKTGYFLDQKENRKIVASLAKGKRVLDTFCHTGAFGLNAFLGGAKEVIAADISEEAVSTTQTNIGLNKAGHTMKVVCADVFDLLRQYEAEKKQFDMIILDPPAFAKTASKVDKAYGGYKEINLRAMRLLVPGGILVTCSCSHFFDTPRFYDMITNAASDAHRRVQIFSKQGAGPDHPVLAGYAKSEYLKCAVVRVM